MSDLAFTTWSTPETDREDAGFYSPGAIALEDRISQLGALALADLVEPMNRTTKPEGTGSITYIDISAVDGRTGDITPSECLASEAPSRARKRVSVGDLLVSSVRPERNAVARVPAELDGAIASTGFFVIRTKEEWRTQSDRLFLFLKTAAFIRQAVRRCTSSMYPVLNEDDFLTILVPIKILEDAGEAEVALQKSDALRRRADSELVRAQALLTELVDSLTSADRAPRQPE